MGISNAKGMTSFLQRKPNQVMAREFIARGNFLWNSGMFCFKAAVFLEELKLYALKYKKQN
jgi:mannose-1-phosphate guanylyltransferase